MIAVGTGLDSATRVQGLEHPVIVAQVTAYRRPASGEIASPSQFGVPRHLPAHEIPITRAFLVRALTERRVRDITAVQLDTPRCPVKNVQPSHCSAAGLPSCHMWVYTSSCRRPSNTSISGPAVAPTTGAVASTSTIGSRRRAVAIASPSRYALFPARATARARPARWSG